MEISVNDFQLDEFNPVRNIDYGELIAAGQQYIHFWSQRLLQHDIE
jgi:hypothetical protein